MLAPQGEALLLSTVDDTGRPLFVADVNDNRATSGSSVPGILQARTLEWVAISFSNA